MKYTMKDEDGNTVNKNDTFLGMDDYLQYVLSKDKKNKNKTDN